MIEWDFDNGFRQDRGLLIAGVDEAGRGPIAGPVTAAAVVFAAETDPFPGIRDSKKLSARQREKAFDWIRDKALTYSVRSVGVRKIRELNILRAALSAMEKAAHELDPVPSLHLIDGNKRPPSLPDAVTVVKGDSRSFSIAAASILAKVSRDRIMEKWAAIYPGYGLEKHKGYPTADHVKAVRELLPLPIHRTDFAPLSTFEFPDPVPRKLLGRWGENWAIYHLITNGYRFLERNVVLGRTGEIDAVFKLGELFVLVEVKTSSTGNGMDPLEWIDDKKNSRLSELSEKYFEREGLDEYEVRIDAVTVKCSDWREPDIEHFKDILNY